MSDSALGLDATMDFLFPTPDRYFLRLVVSGTVESSSQEVYFARGPEGWREVGPHKFDDAPTLAAIQAQSRWARLRFTPTLTRTLGASELGPVGLISLAFPIPIVEPAMTRDAAGMPRMAQPRIDLDVRARVLDTLADLDATLPPHVVVDEGDRIVALYRLAVPIVEPVADLVWHRVRSAKLAHRLAIALGADVPWADEPLRQLIDCPTSTRQELLPVHHVRAWRPHPDDATATVPIERLEEFAETALAPKAVST